MARVRAVDETGRTLVEDTVPHGIDPAAVLQTRGHAPVWVGSEVVDGEVVLVYRVAPGDRPKPHQRLSAYAVVHAEYDGVPSVLLTTFSMSQREVWGLPGGGLDPGEDPVDGAVREVWEETGQRVRDLRPLELVSRHWTGRAPSGRLEDYHAVSAVYRATCPDPVRPVIHDVGGSTADAAWIPLAALPRTPVLDWQRRFLPDG
ncbi:NUDIX domain-containing protein [Ornithinimicrobium sp. F0845]|uniref:NUDIX hydrolase n=1 Tax=Ornithinimicrobium sp. F0845 TaxID=2926412 RepID=UPI001FF339D8|nr:NUDIX domain-containing protein [Ornithinimicrobium sp. F0845]MCK0111150.1 NUDIX domain-containing protein [Ornithinimicrobium sp. F0845]